MRSSARRVYTGRKLWEVEVSAGLKPLAEPDARQAVRYARHRQWGPPPTLLPTTELVVIEDAIYLSDGTSCRVLDPATGEATGRIDLPADVETPWSNLRICDDYLVGSGEITPFFGVRPGCAVNNNLFPANGVLNMPNLTGGCTCNFAPASLACVPAAVVERGGAE